MVENAQMSLPQICILKTLKEQNKNKNSMFLCSHFRDFWGRGSQEDHYLLISWSDALVPRQVVLHLGWSLSSPVGSVTHLLALSFIFDSEFPKDMAVKNFLQHSSQWVRYKPPGHRWQSIISTFFAHLFFEQWFSSSSYFLIALPMAVKQMQI